MKKKIVIRLIERVPYGYMHERYDYGDETKGQDPKELYLTSSGKISKTKLDRLYDECDVRIKEPYVIFYIDNKGRHRHIVIEAFNGKEAAERAKPLFVDYDGCGFSSGILLELDKEVISDENETGTDNGDTGERMEQTTDTFGEEGNGKSAA